MRIGEIRVENEKCICDLCHKETMSTLYCGFPRRVGNEIYASTGYDICKDCAREIDQYIRRWKAE